MYLFKLWFSLDIYLGVGLLGHMVALLFSSLGISSLFSRVAAIYIPTNSVGGFPSLHILFCYNVSVFIFCFLPRVNEYGGTIAFLVDSLDKDDGFGWLTNLYFKTVFFC